MDVAAWTELVQTLGLPIVLIGAMAWFIYVLWKQSAKREERLFAEVEHSQEVNEKAIETIAQYAEKLDNIQGDIKDIKDGIVEITAVIEHK